MIRKITRHNHNQCTRGHTDEDFFLFRIYKSQAIDKDAMRRSVFYLRMLYTYTLVNVVVNNVIKPFFTCWINFVVHTILLAKYMKLLTIDGWLVVCSARFFGLPELSGLIYVWIDYIFQHTICPVLDFILFGLITPHSEHQRYYLYLYVAVSKLSERKKTWKKWFSWSDNMIERWYVLPLYFWCIDIIAKVLAKYMLLCLPFSEIISAALECADFDPSPG